MKLLTAAALPILCVLPNATGLLGQDFDDYVFAQESFNGATSPGSKSEHRWSAKRLRCERLGQATPQSFRAAITILESRGCYSSGFPSDYDSTVPFGFLGSRILSNPRPAESREQLLEDLLIGERMLLEVKAEGKFMSLRAASEKKPDDAPDPWVSAKGKTYLREYPVVGKMMLVAAVRSDFATATQGLENTLSQPGIGKPVVERTDYGHRLRVSGGDENAKVRMDSHFSKTGVLLGTEWTMTNQPGFPLDGVMRGDLPIPSGYEHTHMTLRRIEANGLPWRTGGVFEPILPGPFDGALRLTIVDPKGPLKAVLVANKLPIVINAHCLENMLQLREHLRQIADPRRFPDKQPRLYFGQKWANGQKIYPSSRPLQISCDPGMPTAWVQGVLQACTFMPGKPLPQEVMRSPLIHKVKWLLGGTDAAIPMPLPLPTEQVLADLAAASRITVEMAETKSDTEQPRWSLRVTGTPNEVRGSISAWTIKPDKSGIMLTTQPADLMERIEALATAAKKTDSSTALGLRLDAKIPFALSFAVAARLSGLATADNPITIHGAPADLVKQLDAGTFNR